ncbi:IS607 family transposase [Alkalibaculum bacchi]|uniref:IS607 family transposase n=1 Tax=Alkalibaculum bacchi TaxID=645887 RepID=UPI0026EC2660|nr:IS607 family transposase [Alkalibaculum bacchi]
MRANQVMEILQISRSTLKRYREKGLIKATRKLTGQFEFNDDSVWLFKNKHTPRQTILYGHVSTYKQKHDLANQMQELRDFAENKGYHVDNSFSDIASGIYFKNRKQFFKLLDLVLAGKVERVIITHQDRLSRVGFELFEYLFKNYGTTIETISNEMNPKTDKEELFEEIIILLHCFSMREYSHRRVERKLIESTLNQKGGEKDGKKE